MAMRKLLHLILIVGALAQAGADAAVPCKFTYTKDIRDRFVIPSIKNSASSGFHRYDPKHPFISVDNTHAGQERRILTFKPKFGGRYPIITMAFDACTKTPIANGPFE